MYELVKVGEKTYYIDCPAKMGIYKINDTQVCLIDSGNDKSAGKKVLKILDENSWSLKMIINTHSHADHIGGNRILQDKTNCKIYCAGIDTAFVNNPILEPSFLYGGYPFENLRNKFLMAQSSKAEQLNDAVLPDGMEMKRIDGHALSMAAIKTSDDVWFLADSLTSENIILKYHISYLYDVEAYLNSLETVSQLNGKLFIPAHAEPSDNVSDLVEINMNKVNEIMELLLKLCREPKGFEDILKDVFDNYDLKMNATQYVLVGSTVRSYLSYLYDNKKLTIEIKDNRMLWKSI